MTYNIGVGFSDTKSDILCDAPPVAEPNWWGVSVGGFSSMGFSRRRRGGNRWTLSLSDRFWQYVVKGDGCWVWTGGYGRGGYGIFYVDGHKTTAHRVAWRLTNGEIPADLVIRHTCDNPPCVRPDHLSPGTQLENVADTKERHRFQYGERHWTNRTQRSRDAHGRWAVPPDSGNA